MLVPFFVNLTGGRRQRCRRQARGYDAGTLLLRVWHKRLLVFRMELVTSPRSDLTPRS